MKDSDSCKIYNELIIPHFRWIFLSPLHLKRTQFLARIVNFVNAPSLFIDNDVKAGLISADIQRVNIVSRYSTLYFSD